MTEDANKMSCEAFQAQLPELIGSGENAAAHPHLENCELCRALLADLETIAEAARQLFPIEEPPDKLWEQIESAIKNEETAMEADGPPITTGGDVLPQPQ
jgi:hypothetical protein